MFVFSRCQEFSPDASWPVLDSLRTSATSMTDKKVLTPERKIVSFAPHVDAE